MRKLEQTEAAPKKTCKDYPIGFVHVDVAELHVGKQIFYLFVGIPACSRQMPGVKKGLCGTLRAHEHRPCPGVSGTGLSKPALLGYTLILTDTRSQFTYTKAVLRRGRGPARRHRFTRPCQQHGIRHKTTRPYRPQTNGQVERMNRTIKEAIIENIPL